MGATDDLVALVAQARTADPQTRRKLGRGIGFAAMQIEASGVELTPEEMTTIIDALHLGALVHSYPQRYHVSKARLMPRRRAALGQADAEVLTEHAKTLDIEAGGLILSDSADTDHSVDWLAETNANRIFALSLGRDGEIKTRLRILASDPLEPNAAEFRRLRAATGQVVVKLPSGEIVVSGYGQKSLRATVSPGPWRVTAYGLGLGRAFDALILMAPLTGPLPPPLPDLPDLGI